jgi:hypothetical protein
LTDAGASNDDATTPPEDRPFVTAAGDPKFARCAVLFVDILGVRAMNSGPDAGEHLVALDRAVSKTYRDFLDPRSGWRAAFFSDTLVLARPVESADDEEFVVGGLIVQAALLQFDLALQGFFVRGGLSVGHFHIRSGLIFGPALVAAFDIEKSVAIHPRIVLDEGTDDVKRRFAASPATDGQRLAPLMRDGDGRAFVDYLGLQFDDPDANELLAMHRDVVVGKLQQHRGDKQVWEKFRWVAEYHNAVLAQAPTSFTDTVDTDSLRIDVGEYTWRFERFG